MKKNLSKKVTKKEKVKSNKGESKLKKVFAFIVIGILVCTMIFGSFSYLFYALERV